MELKLWHLWKSNDVVSRHVHEDLQYVEWHKVNVNLNETVFNKSNLKSTVYDQT